MDEKVGAHHFLLTFDSFYKKHPVYCAYSYTKILLMKKINTFLLLLGAFVVLGASQISAQATTTRVRGNLYDMDNGGAAIGGVPVTVNCNGNVQNTSTNGSGLYVVDYPAAQCPAFTAVSASATFNGQPQSQTVYVADVNRATLDFYFGASSVPEFGMIPGLVAAVGSGAAYLGFRRKFSQ